MNLDYTGNLNMNARQSLSFNPSTHYASELFYDYALARRRLAESTPTDHSYVTMHVTLKNGQVVNATAAIQDTNTLAPVPAPASDNRDVEILFITSATLIAIVALALFAKRRIDARRTSAARAQINAVAASAASAASEKDSSDGLLRF